MTNDAVLLSMAHHRDARRIGRWMTLARRRGDIEMAKHLMCDVLWHRQKATELRRAS